MDLSYDPEHDHTHLRDFPTTQNRAWWDLVSGRFGNRGSFRISQLKKGFGHVLSARQRFFRYSRTPTFPRLPSSQTLASPVSIHPEIRKHIPNSISNLHNALYNCGSHYFIVTYLGERALQRGSEVA